MPQRIELTELGGGYVAGAPFVVALARGKRLVAFVATLDADGLAEGAEDCRRAAAEFLRGYEQAEGRND